jgi:hypothetical protein
VNRWIVYVLVDGKKKYVCSIKPVSYCDDKTQAKMMSKESALYMVDSMLKRGITAEVEEK